MDVELPAPVEHSDTPQVRVRNYLRERWTVFLETEWTGLPDGLPRPLLRGDCCAGVGRSEGELDSLAELFLYCTYYANEIKHRYDIDRACTGPSVVLADKMREVSIRELTGLWNVLADKFVYGTADRAVWDCPSCGITMPSSRAYHYERYENEGGTFRECDDATALGDGPCCDDGEDPYTECVACGLCNHELAFNDDGTDWVLSEAGPSHRPR